MTSGTAPLTALVVAHPDDEVLWFSSVLADVDRIIVCFSEIASFPACSAARAKVFAQYPWKNLTVLGLQEAEVFNGADWEAPRLTPYGVAVKRSPAVLPGFSEARYRSNFALLRQRLSAALEGYQRVYTHNPWGEYGHEEHVQVYSAVKSAQAKLGFDVVWSNYVSNKSYPLMASRLPAYEPDYATLPTRGDVTTELLRLYVDSGCWTWYPDYVWPASECMVTEARGSERVGRVFPLNLVTVEPAPTSETFAVLTQWARRTGRRIVRRLLPVSS